MKMIQVNMNFDNHYTYLDRHQQELLHLDKQNDTTFFFHTNVLMRIDSEKVLYSLTYSLSTLRFNSDQSKDMFESKKKRRRRDDDLVGEFNEMFDRFNQPLKLSISFISLSLFIQHK